MAATATLSPAGRVALPIARPADEPWGFDKAIAAGRDLSPREVAPYCLQRTTIHGGSSAAWTGRSRRNPAGIALGACR